MNKSWKQIKKDYWSVMLSNRKTILGHNFRELGMDLNILLETNKFQIKNYQIMSTSKNIIARIKFKNGFVLKAKLNKL